jgi:hypothetical protein
VNNSSSSGIEPQHLSSTAGNSNPHALIDTPTGMTLLLCAIVIDHEESSSSFMSTTGGKAIISMVVVGGLVSLIGLMCYHQRRRLVSARSSVRHRPVSSSFDNGTSEISTIASTTINSDGTTNNPLQATAAQG